MTGKEAILAVRTLTPSEARTTARAAEERGDHTLMRVCRWRWEEPDAFEEIAQLAGIASLPLVTTTPSQQAKAARKIEVRRLRREGHSYTDIAALVGVSVSTVQHYVTAA